MLALTILDIRGRCIPTIPVGTYFEVLHVGSFYSSCKGIAVNLIWNNEFMLVPDHSKRAFIEAAVKALSEPHLCGEHFVRIYVGMRQAFFHQHNPDKLICSTAHGIDFFTNLLAVMDGKMKWREADENGKETIYSQNFNKLAAS